MSQDRWTDEQITIILDIHRPADARAKELGLTRNALIGVSWRMRKSLGLLPEKEIRRGRTKKPSKADQGRKASQAVLDLTRTQCRYPVGDPLGDDFSFCPETAVEERSYCEHHLAVCTLTEKEVKERRERNRRRGWKKSRFSYGRFYT